MEDQGHNSSGLLELLSVAAEQRSSNLPLNKGHNNMVFVQPLAASNSTASNEHPDDCIDVDQLMDIMTIKCKLCNFVCKNKLEFTNHITTQHMQKNSNSEVTVSQMSSRQYFLCGTCSTLFESQEKCKDHMLTEHPSIGLQDPRDDEKVQCPRRGCLYRFHKSDIKVHISCHSANIYKENGELDKSFVCPHCSTSFDKWRQCATHLWRQHSIDVDLLTCSICNRFKTVVPAKLEEHKRIHETEKCFKCDKCDKTFSQIAQLRNHAVTHMDKNSDSAPSWFKRKQCEICSKTFSDSKCLKKHVQAVHSKLKPYICQICNHQSARKAMLEMHMRQHTGEKPYKCDQCSYSSGDHNSLRRHKMGHSKFKPYKCPFCNYGSTQSYAFKNHIVSKHPDKQESIVYSCQKCTFRSINQQSYFFHVKLHDEEDRNQAEKLKNTQLSDQHVDNMKLKTSSKADGDDESKTAMLIDDDSIHATMDFGGTTIPEN